jgi:hypothetical protein
MDTYKLAQQFADTAVQAGRDQMAQVLADLLASPDADAGADGYRDGIEDALLALIQAGAADPRKE